MTNEFRPPHLPQAVNVHVSATPEWHAHVGPEADRGHEGVDAEAACPVAHGLGVAPVEEFQYIDIMAGSPPGQFSRWDRGDTSAAIRALDAALTKAGRPGELARPAGVGPGWAAFCRGAN
jgi:hypothetical protein